MIVIDGEGVTDFYTFDERDYLVKLNADTVKGKTKKEMGTAYFMVRTVLKHNKKARDSDTVLIKEVTLLCKQQKVKVPAHETITRSRRKIQNKDGLYKASVLVRERRKIREKEFRDSMGD